MSREWRAGDVAMVTALNRPIPYRAHFDGNTWWEYDRPASGLNSPRTITPLVVIDPEDREQARHLAHLVSTEIDAIPYAHTDYADELTRAGQRALRSLLAKAKPDEPTDPKARVEDRRENTWRLLADGDWVCTSGPDIGEYIAWERLADERGPLTVSMP